MSSVEFRVCKSKKFSLSDTEKFAEFNGSIIFEKNGSEIEKLSVFSILLRHCQCHLATLLGKNHRKNRRTKYYLVYLGVPYPNLYVSFKCDNFPNLLFRNN